jgi:hypothetical protein
MSKAVLKKGLITLALGITVLMVCAPAGFAYDDKPIIKSVNIKVKEAPLGSVTGEVTVHIEYEPWGVAVDFFFGVVKVKNGKPELLWSKVPTKTKKGFPFEGTFVYPLTLKPNQLCAYRIIAKDNGGPPPGNTVKKEGTFCTCLCK